MNRLLFKKTHQRRRKIQAEDVFVYTEIYGCGKIGKIMAKSYLESGIDFRKYPLNVFGYKSDLDLIPNSVGIQKINLRYFGLPRTRFINNYLLRFLYKTGHRGTAALWAAVIRYRKKGYLIHIDSDTILIGNVVQNIVDYIFMDISLIGPARPYLKNAQGVHFEIGARDLVQTCIFSFRIEPWMSQFPLKKLFKMILGTFDTKGRKILDFFDPVSMKILDDGGTIMHLDFNSVGGINNLGSRSNSHSELNDFNTLRKIDVGSDFIHFSAVGSGVNVYKNKKHNLPFEYAEYAMDRYALYSQIFFQDDLGRDLSQYSDLIEKFHTFLDESGKNFK